MVDSKRCQIREDVAHWLLKHNRTLSMPQAFHNARELLQVLDSVGVVIKVDRELPANGHGSLEDWSYEYVAVESLLEE